MPRKAPAIIKDATIAVRCTKPIRKAYQLHCRKEGLTMSEHLLGYIRSVVSKDITTALNMNKDA